MLQLRDVGALFLGDAFGVAVLAFYEVEVVGALGVFEGGVHFFDVEAAVGKSGVAGGAGRAGLLAVFEVAGEATEAFVNAYGSAVIAGADLLCGEWGVALVAERLALIGAAGDFARAFEEFGKREFGDRDVG